MRAEPLTPMQRSIRRHLVAGVGAMVLLAAGVGGWAATTEFTGAVVAPGQLVVESDVKKVQHPIGGVVSALSVRDGDRVAAGAILLRLDDTETRANLAIVTKALDELSARRAREEAERDGAAEIAFPVDLLARHDDPDVAYAMDGERKLFEIRRAARDGEKAQLREQINQLDEQIGGILGQIDANAKESDWNERELIGIRSLWGQKLVEFTRVTELEQAAARLMGERGQLTASVAEAKGRIAETELKILQVDEVLRTEVGRDLAEIRAKASELVEKEVSTGDRLRRIDLRAPQTGVVHQLQVHTIGAVIGAGETVMVIVPESGALTMEGKVRPQDIDQLHVGQAAVLHLAAFNQRTTPELNGRVSLVSADVSLDQRTGGAYYTIRVTVPEEEIVRLGGLRLVPGMPVEAFVQTTPRTVLSFLTRPVRDQIERAFREK